MMKLTLASLVFSTFAEEFHVHGGVQDLLVAELGSEDLAEDVFLHGCWCNALRIDRTSHLPHLQTTDEVDRLCQRWAKSRKCIDSCEEAPEGTTYHRIHNTCTDNQDSGEVQKCAHNTCVTDLYFARKIRDLVSHEGFLPQEIDPSECEVVETEQSRSVNEDGNHTEQFLAVTGECETSLVTYQNELTCLIDAGCSSCDSVDTTICVSCHTGFELNNQGTCGTEAQNAEIAAKVEEILEKDAEIDVMTLQKGELAEALEAALEEHEEDNDVIIAQQAALNDLKALIAQYSSRIAEVYDELDEAIGHNLLR